jgi:hypothetical protein
VKITIDVPDREWWTLADLAERRGVKVSQMVKLTLTTNHTITQLDVIRSLVDAGLPDADIADRLGLTVMYVAGKRRWMGLKPNRRPAIWSQHPTLEATKGHQNGGPSSLGETA